MKRTTILLLTALALVTINSAFDFGNDPNKQNFRKMTVSYRDFQGGNKNIYKLEEVTKNDKGWVVSHNFYNEAGQLITGSHSFVYDNNGNIKERKDVTFDKSKNKDVTVSTIYINSFEKEKLKRTIITNKDNTAKNDTVDYIRDSRGTLLEKKSRSNGTGMNVFYDEDGKTSKELIYTKGKLTLTRVFEYNSNGFSKITGTNGGKQAELLVWDYNDKGKLLKETRTYEDASKNFVSVYIYNPKGQVTVEEQTIGGVRTNNVYEYDDKGLITKLSIKNEASIRKSERTYVYE